MQIAAQPILEACVRPILFDPVMAVDDGRDLAIRGAGPPTIESDERIAELSGACSPAWQRVGERAGWRPQAGQLGKAMRDGSKFVKIANEKAEGHGRDGGLRTGDGELKGGSSCAQDHVLPAECIEKNMLDIGQGRDTKPRTTGRCCIDLFGRDAKGRTACLGEPDGIGLRGRELGVSESSTGPTPPRGAGGREAV